MNARRLPSRSLNIPLAIWNTDGELRHNSGSYRCHKTTDATPCCTTAAVERDVALTRSGSGCPRNSRWE